MPGQKQDELGHTRSGDILRDAEQICPEIFESLHEAVFRDVLLYQASDFPIVVAQDVKRCKNHFFGRPAFLEFPQISP